MPTVASGRKGAFLSGKLTTTTDLRIEHVPIDKLRLDPANPRRISDAELEALTRSTQQSGLLDPISAGVSRGGLWWSPNARSCAPASRSRGASCERLGRW